MLCFGGKSCYYVGIYAVETDLSCNIKRFTHILYRMTSADRFKYAVVHRLRIYGYAPYTAVFKRPQLIFRYCIGSSRLGGKFTDICNIKFTEFINKAVKLRSRQGCRRTSADIHSIDFKRKTFYNIGINIKLFQ